MELFGMAHYLLDMDRPDAFACGPHVRCVPGVIFLTQKRSERRDDFHPTLC